MESVLNAQNPPKDSLRDQVRSAVIWRSGSQIVGQLVTWGSTFLVIRILSPADYGLYALTSVVLALLALMNGFGLANALIREREASPQLLRQVFGMLLVLNGTLALAQFAAAPLVAEYYGQPMVTQLLRVQVLIYLTNPFLALGYAVLSRRMDFRRQAQVNLLSGFAASGTALGGAFYGLGVWTLVAAPLVGFACRALGMTIAAGTFIRPSFNFSGAWRLAAFGGTVTLGQFFWFVQTQADIAIAGRSFEPHLLGIYTTSLFLTQIFVTKIVPPLNEVAFSAYSRIQDDGQAFRYGFLKSVRVIMLLGTPFCFGLAASADAVVPVVLGPQWGETVQVIAIIGFAMPFMTLQALFGPAANGAGRPGIYTRISLLGAVILPLAFLAGANWGVRGMAFAWLAGYPLLAALSALLVLPALKLDNRDFLAAISAPLLVGAVMAVLVHLLDGWLMPMPALPRLALLVSAGAAIYGLSLLAFARERLAEVIEFARRR